MDAESPTFHTMNIPHLQTILSAIPQGSLVVQLGTDLEVTPLLNADYNLMVLEMNDEDKADAIMEQMPDCSIFFDHHPLAWMPLVAMRPALLIVGQGKDGENTRSRGLAVQMAMELDVPHILALDTHDRTPETYGYGFVRARGGYRASILRTVPGETHWYRQEAQSA